MGILLRAAATSSVRIRKLGSALAAGLIAVSLLLGAGMTQAAEVILEGNRVIRIENLEVFDDQGGPMVYDVNFVYDTGVDVYGSNFNFDFTQEEDAVSALIAVNNALNASSPRPTGAGPNGTQQFFIGVEVEREGFSAAVGGENILDVWAVCETDCVSGVAT